MCFQLTFLIVFDGVFVQGLCVTVRAMGCVSVFFWHTTPVAIAGTYIAICDGPT
eukprot:m.257061 g.257061  ORF g.257061 m.257061 type:complete len:54 (+) comp78570_c0_seq1:143-304(+)